MSYSQTSRCTVHKLASGASAWVVCCAKTTHKTFKKPRGLAGCSRCHDLGCSFEEQEDDTKASHLHALLLYSLHSSAVPLDSICPPVASFFVPTAGRRRDELLQGTGDLNQIQIRKATEPPSTAVRLLFPRLGTAPHRDGVRALVPACANYAHLDTTSHSTRRATVSHSRCSLQGGSFCC